MIVARLDNKAEYYGIHPMLDKVLDLLTEDYLEAVSEEQTLLDGEDLFVTKFQLETVPYGETFFESHKQYLDVQAVTRGMERVEIAHPKGLELTEHQGDFYKYADGEADQTVLLKPGTFAVFFPGDAHRLKIPVREPGEKVTRVVFKLKVY